MDKYAVLGNPIEHSRSPFIHNNFAKNSNQEMEYGKILCPLDKFVETVNEFKKDGGKGLNVTVPFKEEALKYADVVLPRAQRAGAGNTLKFEDGKVYVDNTDGAGIVWDFLRLGWVLKDKSILILGAGGACKGILGPILDEEPKQITIANRTFEKAQLLTKQSSKIVATTYDDLNIQNHQYDLIINSTSCSLHGELPNISEDILKKATYVYDLMYASKDTIFIEKAKELGICNVADGLGMLVGQAALSFKLWRNVEPNATETLELLRKSIK